MGADRITAGPLNLAGTNPFDTEALVLDALNNILSTSGSNRNLQALQTALSVIQAQTALTNVTTAQNLLTKAFNAGALNLIGRTIAVTGYGVYTSPGTTAPVLTFALTLGGVTLATIVTGPMSTTASTGMPFQFEFLFTVASVGSAGTIETHGEVDINLTANTPAGVLNYYPDTNTAVSAAVNLTTALTMALTVAASSSVSSIQLRSAYVEIVA